jgi:hypothetical protein
MAEAREGVRPAVIDSRLHARLEGYRRFRHFFHHAYGQDLEWVKMRLDVEQMAETLAEVRRQLMVFFDVLVSSCGEHSP